jgi:hypothetical protein
MHQCQLHTTANTMSTISPFTSRYIAVHFQIFSQHMQQDHSHLN